VTVEGIVEHPTDETEVMIEVITPDSIIIDVDVIELSDVDDFEYHYEVAEGADDGLYTVRVQYDQWRVYSYFIVDKDQNAIELETDDDVYEAGDDVELRGDVEDLQTGEDEADIIVLDPRGEEIVNESVDLDGDEIEFAFDLDDDAPLGRYAIIVEYDGEVAGEAVFDVIAE
jgi:uncharacterized protein YfaS (alpha-2-macroglobulin family)